MFVGEARMLPFILVLLSGKKSKKSSDHYPLCHPEFVSSSRQMLDPFGSADNSLSSSCQSIDQALDR